MKEKLKTFMGYGKDFEEIGVLDVLGLLLLVVLLASLVPVR